MANILDSLPAGARIAVIRLRSLGDCVLTTPALEILKRARPDLQVGVAVEDRFRPVFEDNPDIDMLLRPTVAEVRGWRPQLCLNLHGGVRSAILTTASGASYRAAFGHFRFPRLYNVRIPRAQEILQVNRKVHTAEHLASAIFYLGAPRAEVPRAKLFATGSAGPPYVVLHPFASHPSKTWPAQRFVAVAEHLRRSLELEPVFIGGAADDAAPFRQYRTILGAPLSTIKSLLSRAALFIGNDSGPSHMAAAFGLPLVVIFGSSDPDVWRPWKTASEILAGIESTTTTQVIGALSRLQIHA